MTSRAAALVAEINRLDIPHRKGWKPSDYVGSPTTIEHLRGEVDELEDALLDLASVQPCARMGDTEYIDHAREEVADVFACVLQTAFRLGLSFEALDAEAERKLRLRFIGADAVRLPGDEP